MSVSFSCHCEERRKPVEQRRWVVVTRKGNYSAFNGYRWASSAYSDVLCLFCGAIGRTKARFVDRLPDSKPGDLEANPLSQQAHEEHLSSRPTGRWAGCK